MVSSSTRPWLRVEGLAFLAGAAALYAQMGAGWLLFAVLFLAPDLSMLGYLAGPRVGAFAYNLAHTYATYLALAGIGLWLGPPLLVALGLIGVAHIGFDRALGYGLKLPTAFQDTHLGRIGRGGVPPRASTTAR
jgi:hypothetical protein